MPSVNMRMLLLLVVLLGSGNAQAHSRGSSYSDWQIETQSAAVQLRVPLLELTRLGLDARFTPDFEHTAAAHLQTELQLWAGSEQCQPEQPWVRAGDPGWLVVQWRVQCRQWQQLSIVSHLFETVASGHLHFTQVQADGRSLGSQVLSFGKPLLVLDAPLPSTRSVAEYFVVGVEHILSGWDHLAFLLGLLLLARSLGELAWLATGFTMAHCLTLAAAVLGWLVPQAAMVEALIGFSILLISVENLWLRSQRDVWIPLTLLAGLAALALYRPSTPQTLVLTGLGLFAASYFGLLASSDQRPQRLRISVSFLFGLVHGFGFAGALSQMQLPEGELGVALFGFNLGVEAGQLLIIALAWPLLGWRERWPRAVEGAALFASCALVALGCFWFVSRIAAS